MICLSIETTGRYLGLSLFSFETKGSVRRLQTIFQPTPMKQSDLLIPTLDQTLKQLELKPSDLSLLAVDVGPGSFTGVRVGLATARALAQGLRRPLVGINSLEAIASRASKNIEEIVVPVIPALAGEVYFAAYRQGKPVVEPNWTTEEKFKAFLSKHKNARVVSDPPHPDAIAKLAVARYQKKPANALFHYENAHPMYLQPSWAERTKRPV